MAANIKSPDLPISYRYPLDQSEVITNKVKFVATATGQTAPFGSVVFHTPTNFTVADGANYGSIDLGSMGGTLQNMYKNAVSEGGGFGSVGSAMKTVGSMASQIGSFAWNNPADIAGSYALGSVPENISKQISYAAKTVVNPHTTTTFQSVEIRSFSFSFKLIAESKEEAKMIKQIDDFFRMNLYPTLTGGGLFLEFPPIWKITFIHGKPGEETENGFLPKIHDCFLGGYSSSYNEDFSSFHPDGAPLSIACEMKFTETKPYNRLNILTGIELS